MTSQLEVENELIRSDFCNEAEIKGELLPPGWKRNFPSLTFILQEPTANTFLVKTLKHRCPPTPFCEIMY